MNSAAQSKIILLKNKIFLINNNNFYQDKNVKIVLSEKNVMVRKRIKYKGIGYKIFLLKKNRLLYLKIGLSFKPIMKLPNDIMNIKFKKGNVLFVSNNKIQLGNFIERLYKIKPQHAYKLKGFILSYKRKKLKAINKK